MFGKWVIRLIAPALLFNFCNSYAVIIQSLNQASVAVSSRAQSERTEALKVAFARVLVKISGNPAIMTIPQVQNSVSAMNQYVESYSYQTRAVPLTDNSQLFLKAVFDQSTIRALLTKTGQTIWGANRPTTLMVVSLGQADHQLELNNPDDPEALALKLAAKQFGLNLLFPVMDLADEADLADLNTSLSADKAASFMARYGVKTLLFGQLMASEDAAESTLQWTLFANGRVSQWQTRGNELSSALTKSMNGLLDHLASQYASMGSRRLQTDVLVKISGVSGLQDYVHLVKKLSHLSRVNKVTIHDMAADSVLLDVRVSGGEQTLIRSIKDVTVLALDIGSQQDQASHVADLYYRWAKPSNSLTNLSDMSAQVSQ